MFNELIWVFALLGITPGVVESPRLQRTSKPSMRPLTFGTAPRQPGEEPRWAEPGGTLTDPQ